jgi:hypothetical protein
LNVSQIDEHYYETLKLSYQLPSPNDRAKPVREAPLPPNQSSQTSNNTGTLSHYHTEFIGVPFVLHKNITFKSDEFEIPKFPDTTGLDYDFSLERQILCATRDDNRKSSSTNPFF